MHELIDERCVKQTGYPYGSQKKEPVVPVYEDLKCREAIQMGNSSDWHNWFNYMKHAQAQAYRGVQYVKIGGSKHRKWSHKYVNWTNIGGGSIHILWKQGGM